MTKTETEIQLDGQMDKQKDEKKAGRVSKCVQGWMRQTRQTWTPKLTKHFHIKLGLGLTDLVVGSECDETILLLGDFLHCQGRGVFLHADGDAAA